MDSQIDCCWPSYYHTYYDPYYHHHHHHHHQVDFMIIPVNTAIVTSLFRGRVKTLYPWWTWKEVVKFMFIPLTHGILWQTNSLLLKMAIDIVDFPIKNSDVPSFFVFCWPEDIRPSLDPWPTKSPWSAFMLAAFPAVAPMAVSSTTTQRMGARPNFLAARL